jgi:hypothetical protein
MKKTPHYEVKIDNLVAVLPVEAFQLLKRLKKKLLNFLSVLKPHQIFRFLSTISAFSLFFEHSRGHA